ncbi:unnamed protein product [Clavelina lepadiformis]|uniref:Uncharacterized protein n=1 Tax=Clavelina lepadiformis TaxID=159417 RepID=A0ABP0GMQ9_CLALP
MRPDAHKKKNSAQYKKKQGLSKGAGNIKSTETKEHDNTRGNKPSENSSNEVSRRGVGEHNGGENFSRRVIGSNWDRYDEPEEVLEEKTGSDFNELVNAAGGFYSHMKLSTEKEWETAQNLDDILTIDFQKLAGSLSQLSFFERLGLNEKEFEPSLVALLNGDDGTVEDQRTGVKSAFKFSNYNFDFSNPSTTSTLTSSDSNQTNSVIKTKKTKAPIIEEGFDIAENRLAELEFEEVITVEKEKENFPEVAKSACDDKKPDSAAEDLETELDVLLSGTAAPQGKKTTLQAKQGIATQIASPFTAATKERADENDDLEEWLDSII